VYIPTAAAPSGVYSKFMCDLQDTTDAVPCNEMLVLLGEFNARVGVLGPDEEVWRGVIGGHGLAERNEAGEEPLQFLCNELIDNHEHLVQKEEYTLWDLDSSYY